MLLPACGGGADAILATRGVVSAAAGEWDRTLSVILRLTGGFTVLGGKFEEEVISSPEAALAFGAAGVAVTVKFGHEREGEFTRQASLVADACERWGLPLMIEAMAKGKDMKSGDPKGILLAARAAQEIGADFVKTYYTGDPESFQQGRGGLPRAHRDPRGREGRDAGAGVHRWCTRRSRPGGRASRSAATSGSTGRRGAWWRRWSVSSTRGGR